MAELQRNPPELFRPPWREGEGVIPRYVVRPTVRFMRIEAAGGVVIVLFALIALIWANIDGQSYHDFWSTEIVFDFDILTLSEPLEGWVNDALMVIFFFVVGLEIKREVIHGELADRRAAAFPVVAAAGGMVVPAVIFTLFNLNSGGGAGWGIPVATDIAFALGVLSLVGNRIPVQLKIFLLALAVADDIGGILIIAFFYTDELDFAWLAAAFALVGVMLAMRWAGIRAIPAYIVAGGLIWLATFESGVEATIAGVALGLLTPVGSLYDPDRLPAAIEQRMEQYRIAMEQPDPHRREDMAVESMRELEELTRESASPLERIEHFLSPWSAFVVIPIFALANAGVELTSEVLEDAVTSEIAWGVAVGLVVGKFIGVLTFSWLSVRVGLAVKPDVIRWSQLAGVSLLAGIGFTVAIFIAGLAYDEALLIEDAKIGILFASIVAAILGYTVLRLVPGRPPVTAPAGSAPAGSAAESAPPATSTSD